MSVVIYYLFDMVEKEEKTVEKTFMFPKDFASALEKEARDAKKTEEEVLNDWFSENGFWVLGMNAEESIISLRYVDKGGVGSLDEVGEDGTESEKNIKIYRELRDTFPPVTAGIDYLKSFVSGSGFTVGVDDGDDPHQKEVQQIINDFNRNIFMDEVTQGLDSIIDIALEPAFVDGCTACEVVYKKFKEAGSFNFHDYVESSSTDKDGKTIYKPRELTEEDWKELGGIVQLKIINNAYSRLKPYRDKRTYQILYWTVDENETESWNRYHKDDQREVIKLLPWQIFWFSPNRRGTRLKGPSMIKPVATTALLLKKILNDVGISFDKWADRKYFFILGSDKTGRSWAPPHIRNFLANVKKMSEKGGVGIPVPPGFDVKDIGGEVYDGGQILDRLISMIVGGMKYPRTFLEQGKTQEGDKAWLAWLVTYGRIQTQLRRCVEHQLWKRHLNCIYGFSYETTKRGPEPEGGRPRKPVYVPKMQWRSEGKWHMETKLKMLYGGLNVANPIGPETKLEIETDIAKTLGYSEMNLDVARELLRIDRETEKVNREIELLNKKMELELLQKAYKEKAYMDEEPRLKFVQPSITEQPTKSKPPPEKLAEGEEEKKPSPVEKRLAGGVSKRKKETGTKSKKGVARPLGSTRKPKNK